MRVIIVSIGSQGDLYPLLGIGSALRDRGHQVTVLASSYFEPVIQKAGLSFFSIGSAQEFTDALDILEDSNLRSLVFQHLYLRPMKPVYDYLSGHCQDGAGVVVCNVSSLGARLAREKLGVPMVTINLAPMMFLSSYDPPLFTLNPYPRWVPRHVFSMLFQGAHLLFDWYICPKLNEFRKQIGLRPQRRAFHWMLSPDKIIALFPDWFAKPQPDWPAQTEQTSFPLFDEGALPDRNLPAELEKFLSSGEAPIVFTPGTPNKRFSAFFEKAVAATTALGKRALLISKFKEQIPRNLPDHIRFFEYVPFSQVLNRAALLVYHGGIGTMAQAMRAGIPHLITPWGIDQFDNGARVKALGIGDVTSSRSCTPESLAEKLQYLLNTQEVHEKCKVIARKIQTAQPLSDICRIIESVGTSPGTSPVPAAS